MNVIRLSFKVLRSLVNSKTFSATKIARFHLMRQVSQLYYATGLAFLWPLQKKVAQAGDEIPRSTLLENADNLFDDGRYDECYHLLLSLQNIKGPKDVEIEWRICRVLYNMAKEPKYDEKTKNTFIINAFEIISSVLTDNWNHHAVQKWYALLLDSKSSIKGMKERIKQLENVKKHMDLAVTLNPNDATTLFMLGEWCYQVTELTWFQRKIAEVLFGSPPYSTYEDALEYFLRAESVQPRFYSLNLLRLGICYLKLKKEDQAKYYLKLAACYPAKSNDDHMTNKEAAELLKSLK